VAVLAVTDLVGVVVATESDLLLIGDLFDDFVVVDVGLDVGGAVGFGGECSVVIVVTADDLTLSALGILLSNCLFCLSGDSLLLDLAVSLLKTGEICCCCCCCEGTGDNFAFLISP
jgi:hypothetical protein